MTLLDNAVRAASSAGLHVLIDPAFSAPLWATSERRPQPSGSGDRWYQQNINVRQIAAWEQMLARRYSGRYRPPGQRRALPRVATFALWNEPNEAGYLAPQWRVGVPVSADWDRQLVQLAYPAIKRVSPGATVLIGDTSATGGDAQSSAGGVPPLAFIRRLACVNASLQPVHDGSCARFHAVLADGYAHHPYERGEPPWVAGPRASDWGQMGDLLRLQDLLDKLVAMHRLAPGAEHLWLTEQGYESNAELKDRPWTEAQQAELNAASEYLAWRDPQLASFSQFLLRDTRTEETVALRRRTGQPHALLAGTWTSGLLREDSVPKPALGMFRSPVVARLISVAAAPSPLVNLVGLLPVAVFDQLEVWGRARPARSPTPVVVQTRSGSAAAFHSVQRTSTDRNGIFDVYITLPADAGVQLRFRWLGLHRSWQSSPTVRPVAIPGL